MTSVRLGPFPFLSFLINLILHLPSPPAATPRLPSCWFALLGLCHPSSLFTQSPHLSPPPFAPSPSLREAEVPRCYFGHCLYDPSSPTTHHVASVFYIFILPRDTIAIHVVPFPPKAYHIQHALSLPSIVGVSVVSRKSTQCLRGYHPVGRGCLFFQTVSASACNLMIE